MSDSRLTRRRFVKAAGLALPASALLACRPGDGAQSSSAGRTPIATERDVERIVLAEPTTDGAGVKLHRSLGSRTLQYLDPFLMLDEFYTDRAEDYLAGFPNHPHRGFETVTYMIHGAMEHRDSMGNHGRLGPGSAQWMTAGSGIIHSEMPKQEKGLMWGFQLWVNLPAMHKMTKPRYQDIAPGQIHEVRVGDATVRVVAGEIGGVRGPVEGIVTAPQMLDFKLPARGAVDHTMPPAHAAFAYVFDGAVQLGRSQQTVERGHLAVLTAGDSLHARSEIGGRFLLLAGAPIGEPVARYGPFVMNTDEEIRQAMHDYQTGKLVQG